MPTMTARDAAQRMGVKVETLYAYVSRGLLSRAVGPDGRSSVFDPREVEALARRGRPRQSSRSTSLNMLIETRLTELTPQGVRYRGLSTADLATTHTFEQVADLLWLGRLGTDTAPWPGESLPLPPDLDPIESIAVTVALATPRSGRITRASTAVDGVALRPEPSRSGSGRTERTSTAVDGPAARPEAISGSGRSAAASTAVDGMALRPESSRSGSGRSGRGSTAVDGLAVRPEAIRGSGRSGRMSTGVDGLAVRPEAISGSGRSGRGSTAVDGSGPRQGGSDRATSSERAEEVAAVGRRLIGTVVDSLLPAGGARSIPRLVLGAGSPISGSIAGRLWARLSPRRPSEGMLAVLNAALVLLADHDLAASTFGVRVAASTRADPASCVAAGLGVLRGPLHGGASVLARALLDEASSVGAPRAVAHLLRDRRRVPGFGHKVYTDTDPRATVLLRLLGEARGTERTLRVVDDVRAETTARTGHAVNVDLALAAFGSANGLAPEAGEAIMATARIAGWLAHTIEEYGEAPLRFRPRALYVG